MQNKFSKFIKAKGYYIVLLICAVAVGVTGYLLLTTEEEPKPKVQAVANVTQAPTETTMAPESTQEQEATTAEPKAPFRLKKPLSGEAVTAFAADHLAYNATTRDWRTHEGLDLAAVIGQEVCAAADGTVLTIYEDENYGMTVVMRHTDGYNTHYSNLSEEVQVEVGQAIAVGSVLGTVGNTANSETATESHLHFALYQDNVPVDPSEYFD